MTSAPPTTESPATSAPPTTSESPAPSESPVPSAEPTPVPTLIPTSTPEAEEIWEEEESDENDWNEIYDDLKKLSEGKGYEIDLDDETVVPGDVFDSIKGKDVAITLDLGNGLSWTINGKSITSDNVPDINFGVEIASKESQSNKIPVEILNVVTGERYYMNVTLLHSGPFGLTATLNINLGTKNNGLYANLFYYNEGRGAMEFIGVDDIDASGMAHLLFTHASEYAIVIDKAPMGTNGNSPKTGEEAKILPYAMSIVLLGMFVCAGVLAKMRKEEK